MYVHDLLRVITFGGGCYFVNCYVGCIMHADDLLLLSDSVLVLQTMLDTCGCVGKQLGYAFNAKKIALHCIGPDCISNISNLSVDGSSIMWVDNLSYLGIRIIANKKFKVDLTACRRKYFAAVNCIYSKYNTTDDLVKLFLMKRTVYQF